MVNETKSLYLRSSVAVNVDSASTNSSQALLNCLVDSACRPWYTFKRLRRSQSPPFSINLCLNQYQKGSHHISTHPSARLRFLVIIEWSPKKKPIRASVKTMSILEPTPGVLSKASSCAAIERSWNSPNQHRKSHSM